MIEDDLRKLIREEIRIAFEDLAKQADELRAYYSDSVVLEVTGAIMSLAQGVAEGAMHHKSCRVRQEKFSLGYYCDCGMREADEDAN